MCQSYVRLPRLFTSLAVAGMLGAGAHALVGPSASADARVDGSRLHPGCKNGAADGNGCDTQSGRSSGPGSAGECTGSLSHAERGCLSTA